MRLNSCWPNGGEEIAALEQFSRADVPFSVDGGPSPALLRFARCPAGPNFRRPRQPDRANGLAKLNFRSACASPSARPGRFITSHRMGCIVPATMHPGSRAGRRPILRRVMRWGLARVGARRLSESLPAGRYCLGSSSTTPGLWAYIASSRQTNSPARRSDFIDAGRHSSDSANGRNRHGVMHAARDDSVILARYAR